MHAPVAKLYAPDHDHSLLQYLEIIQQQLIRRPRPPGHIYTICATDREDTGGRPSRTVLV